MGARAIHNPGASVLELGAATPTGNTGGHIANTAAFAGLLPGGNIPYAVSKFGGA